MSIHPVRIPPGVFLFLFCRLYLKRIRSPLYEKCDFEKMHIQFQVLYLINSIIVLLLRSNASRLQGRCMCALHNDHCMYLKVSIHTLDWFPDNLLHTYFLQAFAVFPILVFGINATYYGRKSYIVMSMALCVDFLGIFNTYCGSTPFSVCPPPLPPPPKIVNISSRFGLKSFYVFLSPQLLV